MKLVNQIRGNFPKTIDKGKPIFSALIANDNGNAAIQKQLEYLLAYMKEWISTPDVYKQTGTMLEKTITFFSYLERFADESEKSLKNRFGAIFVRNHDTKWGTPYDVKSVFQQYFPHATIYLIKNVNKIDATETELQNFITDGDIDTDTPSDWTTSDCSATKAARFSKSFGFEMDDAGGYFYQEISNLPNRKVISGTEPAEYKNLAYFLHFFMSGKVNVRIEDTTNNKWWDYSSKTWKSSAVDNTFEQAEWDDCSLYFITETNDDTINLKVSFYYPDSLLAAELEKVILSGLIPVTWTKTNCSTTVEDDRTVINLIQSDSTVTTTTNVVSGQKYNLKFTYKVKRHIPYNPNNPNKLYVVVKSDNDKYWNFDSQVWTDTEYKNKFTSTSWVSENKEIIAGAADTNFDISFEYGDDLAYLEDSIRFEGAVSTTETLTDCTVSNNVITLPQKTSDASYVGGVEAIENYKLNYTFNGRLAIVVQNDNGDYWDFMARTWKSSIIKNEFFSNDETEKELVINTTADTTQLTISYVMIPNYLDYFRLFQKQPYSSFTVIAHFEGNSSVGTFGLAAGDDDPNIATTGDTPPQPRYGNYGYFDKSFMSGVPIGFSTDIYEDLLDYLRSQGVKAFLDIIIKDV